MTEPSAAPAAAPDPLIAENTVDATNATIPKEPGNLPSHRLIARNRAATRPDSRSR